MNVLRKIALHFARKSFCKTAIEEHADLGAFKERLTAPIIAGIALVALSYTIGLPTVIAFCAFAASINKPLIGIIGGALIYGISTLMFIIGIKMAGTKYFVALNRWLARVILEKILGPEVKAHCAFPEDETGSETLKS
ncbi:MAG: hypothetical protein ABFD50_11785 [Smithella sp.]